MILYCASAYALFKLGNQGSQPTKKILCQNLGFLKRRNYLGEKKRAWEEDDNPGWRKDLGSRGRSWKSENYLETKSKECPGRQLCQWRSKVVSMSSITAWTDTTFCAAFPDQQRPSYLEMQCCGLVSEQACQQACEVINQSKYSSLTGFYPNPLSGSTIQIPIIQIHYCLSFTLFHLLTMHVGFTPVISIMQQL